jgi:hypothetical protein
VETIQWIAIQYLLDHHALMLVMYVSLTIQGWNDHQQQWKTRLNPFERSS